MVVAVGVVGVTLGVGLGGVVAGVVGGEVTVTAGWVAITSRTVEPAGAF